MSEMNIRLKILNVLRNFAGFCLLYVGFLMHCCRKDFVNKTRRKKRDIKQAEKECHAIARPILLQGSSRLRMSFWEAPPGERRRNRESERKHELTVLVEVGKNHIEQSPHCQLCDDEERE